MRPFTLPLPADSIIITCALGICCSLFFCGIRFFVRLKDRTLLGWDDAHCTIAVVFAVGYSALSIAEIPYGLGRPKEHLTVSDMEYREVIGWVGGMYYILTQCFASLSMCSLSVRITRQTRKARVAQTLAAVIIAWAVISFFVTSFACKLPRPWITRPATRCLDLVRFTSCSAPTTMLISSSSMSGSE